MSENEIYIHKALASTRVWTWSPRVVDYRLSHLHYSTSVFDERQNCSLLDNRRKSFAFLRFSLRGFEKRGWNIAETGKCDAFNFHDACISPPVLDKWPWPWLFGFKLNTLINHMCLWLDMKAFVSNALDYWDIWRFHFVDKFSISCLPLSAEKEHGHCWRFSFVEIRFAMMSTWMM